MTIWTLKYIIQSEQVIKLQFGPKQVAALVFKSYKHILLRFMFNTCKNTTLISRLLLICR